MFKDNRELVSKERKSREKEIIHTSLIALVGSLLLASVEIMVGIWSKSGILILYGIETVSTGLASLVIITGIKLSAKEPDRRHPLGYGRLEYISDMVVATIIVNIGITALITAVKTIIAGPTITEYNLTSYTVLVVAMVTKFLLAVHEREVAKKTRSKALAGTAIDSFANSFVSFSIIVSSVIYAKYGKNVENYVGLLVAFFIIRNGYEIFLNTLTEVLGRRASKTLIHEIKETIMGFEHVIGVYDFVLHSYGRDKYVGSVHIEILTTLPILELEIMQRRIKDTVYLNHGVMLTAIGIYATDEEDEDFMKIYNYLNTFAKHCKDIEEVHGLFLDKENKQISFDIVLDHYAEDKDILVEAFKTEIQDEYKDYTVNVNRDMPL